MSCENCEKLLESELKRVSGVASVRVSRRDHSAEISYFKSEPEFTELKQIVEKFGYQAYPTEAEISSEPKRIIREWIEAILILTILLLIYQLLRKWGEWEKIGINYSKITYGISFLIGLTASVSSCFAVVGSVVIAFAEKYQCRGGGFFSCAVKPNLLFHAGRLLTFFLLGGGLGVVGGEINLTGKFIFLYSITIAVIMAWLGLNILGILPSIVSVGLRMPGRFIQHWVRLKDSEHALAPFLLGSLTFFLPCGFTQSMQVFALTSGSFISGGLHLLLFALGTLPVLLMVGITASWTKMKKLQVLQKVAGFLILLFASSIFNSGISLKSWKGNLFALNQDEERIVDRSESSSSSLEQIIEMHVTYRGFEPNILTIKKGIPVTWKIYGDQVTQCTDRIIVPSLKLSKAISPGENIIRFTPPGKRGEIPFSCWMGMVRGKFVIE